MMAASLEEGLYESRLMLKTEMARALKCRTAGGKRRLVEEWKRKYPAVVWEQMLRCARHPDACRAIAGWNLDDFDGGRRK